MPCPWMRRARTARREAACDSTPAVRPGVAGRVWCRASGRGRTQRTRCRVVRARARPPWRRPSASSWCIWSALRFAESWAASSKASCTMGDSSGGGVPVHCSGSWVADPMRTATSGASPRSRNASSSARWDRWLTAMVSSMPASVRDGPLMDWIPALQTTASNRGSRATAAVTSCRLRWSMWTGSTPTLALTSCRRGRSRPVPHTEAPRCRRAAHVARPNPLVAPVTRIRMAGEYGRECQLTINATILLWHHRAGCGSARSSRQGDSSRTSRWTCSPPAASRT